jgi:hypothetical protein
LALRASPLHSFGTSRTSELRLASTLFSGIGRERPRVASDLPAPPIATQQHQLQRFSWAHQASLLSFSELHLAQRLFLRSSFPFARDRRARVSSRPAILLSFLPHFFFPPLTLLHRPRSRRSDFLLARHRAGSASGLCLAPAMPLGGFLASINYRQPAFYRALAERASSFAIRENPNSQPSSLPSAALRQKAQGQRGAYGTDKGIPALSLRDQLCREASLMMPSPRLRLLSSHAGLFRWVASSRLRSSGWALVPPRSTRHGVHGTERESSLERENPEISQPSSLPLADQLRHEARGARGATGPVEGIGPLALSLPEQLLMEARLLAPRPRLRLLTSHAGSFRWVASSRLRTSGWVH